MTETILKSVPARPATIRSPAAVSASARPLISLLVILESLRQSDVLTSSLKS